MYFIPLSILPCLFPYSFPGRNGTQQKESSIFPWLHFLLDGELPAAAGRGERRQLQSDSHARERAGFSQQDARRSGESADRARAEGLGDRRPQERKVVERLSMPLCLSLPAALQ